MAYLYRHIRLDKNIPFYIGISFGTDGKYFRSKDKGSRSKVWNAIVKKTDYRVDIIMDDLTDDEASEKEIEFIKLYGRMNIKTGTLCNLTDGGFGGMLGYRHSKESKEKIGNAGRGKKMPPQVREALFSEQSRAKMSAFQKTKRHSQESIAKMRLVQQKPPMSDDVKEKLSKVHKELSKEKRDRQNAGRHVYNVNVYLRETNEFIAHYTSTTKCAKELGIGKTTLRRYITGKSKEPQLKYYFEVTKRPCDTKNK